MKRESSGFPRAGVLGGFTPENPVTTASPSFRTGCCAIAGAATRFHDAMKRAVATVARVQKCNMRATPSAGRRNLTHVTRSRIQHRLVYPSVAHTNHVGAVNSIFLR